MSDDIRVLAVDIVYPPDGGCIEGTPQPGSECNAEWTASGTATRNGWTAICVRVLLLQGHHDRPKAKDVFADGEDAEITTETGNPTSWRKPGLLTRCNSDDCKYDSKYTLAVAVKWQSNDPQPAIEWEPDFLVDENAVAIHSRFTVKCRVDNLLRKGPQDTAKSTVWREGDWTYYALNLESGDRLLAADLRTALRVRRIACFARVVQWFVQGLPWLSVRSPLGLLRIEDRPAARIAPREPGAFLGAVIVQQGSRLVPSPDNFPVHPRLYSVVSASCEAEATVIDLDAGMDAAVRLNVLPSVSKHAGAVVVAVKVLE